MAATVEYDGGDFAGWQRQPHAPSVQAAVEDALGFVAGHPVIAVCAGRTDSGVHATGQVIHIHLDKDWPADVVRDALNAHLIREPIVILEAQVAPLDFHARFSAIERRYLYRILDRRAPPALDRGRVWHVKSPLDADAMQAAAHGLLGLHDFTTFRDAKCQAKSPIKTLDAATVAREGDEVRVSFAARSFLHRQVRSMVGALVQVGLGRWTADDLIAALEAKNRGACAPVAPADGLYLTGVGYGDVAVTEDEAAMAEQEEGFEE